MQHLRDVVRVDIARAIEVRDGTAPVSLGEHLWKRGLDLWITQKEAAGAGAPFFRASCAERGELEPRAPRQTSPRRLGRPGRRGAFRNPDPGGIMLAAYDVSLDFIRELRPVVTTLGRHDRDLASQLQRAATNSA